MIIYGLNSAENIIKTLDAPERPVHLAIGTFDGVHLGHQKLIESAISKAKEDNGIAAALTFWPHPSHFFAPKSPIPTIMSSEIKNRFLEGLGLDIVIEQNFTENFARLSPEDFVKLLVKVFPKLKTIHAGNDFHFGFKRQGDVNFLERTGKYLGFEVIKQKNVHYQGERVSSTRIRQSLENGYLEDANEMLGYPYFSIGLVINTDSPLSIVWNPELKPKYGLYAINVQNQNHSKKYKGIGHYTNYGYFKNADIDLTDDGTSRLDIYLCEESELGTGDALKVEWLKFLDQEPAHESEDQYLENIMQKIEEFKTKICKQ